MSHILPDQSLRIEALARAVDLASTGDSGESVVKRAEKFYEFLVSNN